jgi:hypothetical protein
MNKLFRDEVENYFSFSGCLYPSNGHFESTTREACVISIAILKREENHETNSATVETQHIFKDQKIEFNGRTRTDLIPLLF